MRKRFLFAALVLCFCVTSFSQNSYQYLQHILPTGDTLYFVVTQYDVILTNIKGNYFSDSENNIDREGLLRGLYNNYMIPTGAHHYNNISPSTYTGVCKDIVIPDTLRLANGSKFPVTRIYSGAFADADWLKSVVIPNTVRRIGVMAFVRCRNLERVEILGGENTIDIDCMAFAACYNLKKVILPSCNIETAAFYGATMDTIIMNGNCRFTKYGHYATPSGRNIEETPPFEHDSISVYPSHGPWTTLILADTVTEMTVPMTYNIGGYSFAFPSKLRKFGIFNTSHFNITLPDSLEWFKQIGAHYIQELVIPDDAKIEVLSQGNSYYESDNYNHIKCYSLRKLTTGKCVRRLGITGAVESYALDSVIIRSRNLMGLRREAFPFRDIHIIVPCGKLDEYRDMAGQTTNLYFSEDTTNCNIMVEVRSNNEQWGTVSGGGLYEVNTTATLRATPRSGHSFVSWSNGETQNPLIFEVVDDTVITAFFSEYEGIEESIYDNYSVYTNGNNIVIHGANGLPISVIGVDGKTIVYFPKAESDLSIPIDKTGVYLVKIGNNPARKVTVIR